MTELCGNELVIKHFAENSKTHCSKSKGHDGEHSTSGIWEELEYSTEKGYYTSVRTVLLMWTDKVPKDKSLCEKPTGEK